LLAEGLLGSYEEKLFQIALRPEKELNRIPVELSTLTLEAPGSKVGVAYRRREEKQQPLKGGKQKGSSTTKTTPQ